MVWVLAGAQYGAGPPDGGEGGSERKARGTRRALQGMERPGGLEFEARGVKVPFFSVPEG